MKLERCTLLNCFGIYARLLIVIRMDMDTLGENAFDTSYLIFENDVLRNWQSSKCLME